jgi:hypothetical protein
METDSTSFNSGIRNSTYAANELKMDPTPVASHQFSDNASSGEMSHLN